MPAAFPDPSAFPRSQHTWWNTYQLPLALTALLAVVVGLGIYGWHHERRRGLNAGVCNTVTDVGAAAKVVEDLPDTPNLDIANAHAVEIGTVGAFLDWLSEHGMAVASQASNNPGGHGWAPVSRDRGRLIAEFIGYDLDGVEREMRAMLAVLNDGNRS